MQTRACRLQYMRDHAAAASDPLCKELEPQPCFLPLPLGRNMFLHISESKSYAKAKDSVKGRYRVSPCTLTNQHTHTPMQSQGHYPLVILGFFKVQFCIIKIYKYLQHIIFLLFLPAYYLVSANSAYENMKVNFCLSSISISCRQREPDCQYCASSLHHSPGLRKGQSAPEWSLHQY